MNIEKKIRNEYFELRKTIQNLQDELSDKEDLLDYLEEKNNKIKELESKPVSTPNTDILKPLNDLYSGIQFGEIDKKELLKQVNILINKANGHINTDRLKLDPESKTDITLQEKDIHETKTPRFG